MKPGRLVGLIALSLAALVFLAAFFAGAALLAAYASERGDDGFFESKPHRIGTATAAVTSEDVDLGRETDSAADWFFDTVDATIKLEAEGDNLFVGIGPASDVEAFLTGVARDEIEDFDDRRVNYRNVAGTAAAPTPTAQGFWVASDTGSGTIAVEWDVESGAWTAVLMNADGSPGVVADVVVGAKAGIIAGLGAALLIIGGLLAALTVVLLVTVARGSAAEIPGSEPRPEPVRLTADLDEPLSPWKWLVKWFLAIPHFVVLAFLWIGFVVVTVIAFFAILFTGRYPRPLFNYNVGVLRWSWRVLYYAGTGGLGTDRYPPFSLQPAEYPATLDIDYPERLSRGLVLVKWWLLAVPHYLLFAAIAGGGAWAGVETGPGLPGVLVVVAAVILLFTERYPRRLFDLIVGVNRWGFRVASYVALMTDRYPPFRLDQGGDEPGG